MVSNHDPELPEQVEWPRAKPIGLSTSGHFGVASNASYRVTIPKKILAVLAVSPAYGVAAHKERATPRIALPFGGEVCRAIPSSACA